ncbi:MAG: hypothetical protein HQK51_21390 [Oligoflexia bacterium]|nr:hypothetical protein [Oligoflexia bacterium]
MDETKALKKYSEHKGDPPIFEELISQLSEEKFFEYAHIAYCKKNEIEIGKYDFFRKELPKYNDMELKKMVLSLFKQEVI